MEIIVLIGFLLGLFTGGFFVLGLIFIVLKYALGLMLVLSNMILICLCWLYEIVSKQPTPAHIDNFINRIEAFAVKMTTAPSKSSDNYNYSDHYYDNADDF